jgi:hypothetical protein
MKKIVCGFVFGLMLTVTGVQAWADNPIPIPPSNPKLSVILASPLADNPIPIPPANPKLAGMLSSPLADNPIPLPPNPKFA